MKSLGKQLAALRKTNGYTQEELSKKLSEMHPVSQQVISNIERDVSIPDIKLLACLADLYDISLDDLIGRPYSKEKGDPVETQINSHLKTLDSEGKELCLGIIEQVAQRRDNNGK